ncbi:MAG: alkaline phosphatase family protein [Verrucomicrobia bacterium]|nr:alkaline phosphatase family protein [Verrucomicrobiota bacterium]
MLRISFFKKICRALLPLLAAASTAQAAPKVILISLDGATPQLVESYLASGALPPDTGLGRLAKAGVRARRNVSVLPSLTAPAHAAMVTGSAPAANDLIANSFHLTASPFALNINGFAAPIGGPALGAQTPTAQPIWMALRAAGKKVIAAPWPNVDGQAVRLPVGRGQPISGGTVIAPAEERAVDFTVPFGEDSGVAACGFALTRADFIEAPPELTAQLTAAGHRSFSPVLWKKLPLETISTPVPYGQPRRDQTIAMAALDTTDDGAENYDTLVFFDTTRGIEPGPFALPATGPAYVRAGDGVSRPFYLEGSARQAGTAFFISQLAPDLGTVRIARYAVHYLPRNVPPAVLASVDDINAHVGACAAKPDIAIAGRWLPSFANFPDAEREAIFEDQAKTWTDYQARVAVRALEKNPDADLALFYFSQPDSSAHQFLLTDPRQASDPLDPASLGARQDAGKAARYANYLQEAYRAVNDAVERIIQAAGGCDERTGRPRANVFVVSDHGFLPFHTAVNIHALLQNAGFDPKKVRAVPSGAAVNIYLNLRGREPDGIVPPAEYLELQKAVVTALQSQEETNANYLPAGEKRAPIFDKIFVRPAPPTADDPSLVGRTTDERIGHDSGDVLALLAPGYDFDGTQRPPVRRSGDDADSSKFLVLSVPDFYGAHGYDPARPEMSAIFFAAGPDIPVEHGGAMLDEVHLIDLAPTIEKLLGVAPAPTVQGRAIDFRRTTPR